MEKTKKIVLTLMCAFWLGLIFYFSSKNAQSSTEQTGIVLNIIEYLSVRFPKVESFFDALTRNHSIIYVVRKMAHMFVFCMLQILIFTICRLSNKSLFKSALISIACVMLYAGLDEFHQVFVPGRDGSIKDVFIDTIGGMIGLLISLTFYNMKKYMKRYN